MVKFCFECGAKNNGGRFCAECGTKFTTPDGGGGASAAPGGNSNGAANAVAAQLNQQMGTTAFTGGAVTAAAPHVANAGFAAAKSAYRNESMGGAVPMAVPVGGGAAAGSFNYGSSRPSAFATNGTNGIPPPPPPPPPPPAPAAPSAFRSSFNGSFNGGNGNNNNGNATNAPAFRSSFSSSNKSFNNNSFNGGGYETQAAGQAPAEPVPPAATGAEAQEVYESCVQTIRAARGGGNETGVKAFKQNCKAFGLKQIDVKTFYDSLVAELGLNDTRNFVPHLSRLIPDDMLRKDLIEYNSRQQRVSAFSSGANGQPAPYLGSAGRDSSSSSDSNSSSRRSFSSGGAGKSKGILKNRYADHPNCDICNVGFDVTKRRHQCRRCGLNVCNSCTPVRLLIPPEMVIENAKKYEPSVPQRVCIQCAPQLHQYQDELVAQYAQSKEQNMHQSKGAIHVPFSNSLMKECNNAADIIGNFFRDSWGSSTDRSIPVAFLQKAHGLAIMTIIKAGFLVTGKIGTGLVVAKLPDGSWSAPSAIGTIGLGGGFEIGGEIVEVMIILGSEGAVKVFHKPQVNLGAGLDVTVGPYGRSALAAAAVSTSGLNANYSYSQSKGLYAGISLQGAVIAARSDLNRKFYGRDLPPGEILSGYVEQPAAARPLYEAIDMAMQGVEDHKNEAMRRSSIMGPCRLCNCPMFVAHTHQVWNKSCKTCKHVH